MCGHGVANVKSTPLIAQLVRQEFLMISYLVALAVIALSLSILMAGAWVVQQRTGNSGWVDTIWTFSLGLVGAASALWPIAGAAPNPRQWLVAALVAIWSIRL